ncbi:hypothetical protein M0D21_05715 [Aquimarina sp. D1M17]|uniref:hypothetical protein n=1 Tax=Aquimarina acroporae TaxID=2937283 RepID=UPI0020C160F6|nr:hypothetical protein [Aquimarina acroporae]MCK8521052.1 hypothetical protein [Aquimarina acroporae]
MNKLDFSISLRAKGLSKQEIIKEMVANEFDESDIKYYLKKSDEIYLNQLLNNKRTKDPIKPKRTLKSIALILSLVLLIGVFYGYLSIGLIGLFILWSLVKFGTYRRS